MPEKEEVLDTKRHTIAKPVEAVMDDDGYGEPCFDGDELAEILSDDDSTGKLAEVLQRAFKPKLEYFS